jgi:death-on-curing protein
MEVFLLMNGFEILASTDEQETTVIAVASGSLSRNSLAEWLEQHLQPVTKPA